MAPVELALLLSLALLAVGAVGVLTRRSLIATLLSVELMLNGVLLAFVAANRAWPAGPTGVGEGAFLDGQIFALLIVTVAAAQAAVGVGIVVSTYRTRGSLDVEDANELKW